jgi:hypothetical protein
MSSRVEWSTTVDLDERERWVNEHVANGWALVGNTLLRYEFEECTPGEYIYRLEVLSKPTKAPESQEYLRFVRETGAEVAVESGALVWFRKKAADGPFEIFSDVDSRLAYYQRLGAGSLGMLAIVVVNVALDTANVVLSVRAGDDPLMIGAWSLTLVLWLAVLAIILRRHTKLRALKAQALLSQ